VVEIGLEEEAVEVRVDDVVVRGDVAVDVADGVAVGVVGVAVVGGAQFSAAGRAAVAPAEVIDAIAGAPRPRMAWVEARRNWSRLAPSIPYCSASFHPSVL
jgi:hypothetical protein